MAETENRNIEKIQEEELQNVSGGLGLNSTDTSHTTQNQRKNDTGC